MLRYEPEKIKGRGSAVHARVPDVKTRGQHHDRKSTLYSKVKKFTQGTTRFGERPQPTPRLRFSYKLLTFHGKPNHCTTKSTVVSLDENVWIIIISQNSLLRGPSCTSKRQTSLIFFCRLSEFWGPIRFKKNFVSIRTNAFWSSC